MGSRGSQRNGLKPTIIQNYASKETSVVGSMTPTAARPSLSKIMPLCFRENPNKRQRAM